MVDVPNEGMLCATCLMSRGDWNSGTSSGHWNNAGSTPASSWDTGNNTTVPGWNTGSSNNMSGTNWINSSSSSDIPDEGQSGFGQFQTASVKVGHKEYRGKVRSIQSYHEPRRRPSFVSRWVASVFNSACFSMKPMHLVMQISLEAQDTMRMGNVGTAKNVHIFADDADRANLIVPGNTVVVHGDTDHSGVVQATHIYNETTGVSISGGTSPWLVRVATLVLLAVLVLMFSGAASGFPGAMGSVSGYFQRFKDNFTSIIALIIVGVMFLVMIKKNPRLRKITIWLLVLLIASVVIPPAAPLVVMVFGLWFLINRGL